MRVCRVCGIGLTLDSPIQYRRPNGKARDGAICKYCQKADKRERNVKANKEGVFRKYKYRYTEPMKKECTECKKNFWTTTPHKLTCSKECSHERNKRVKRAYNRKIRGAIVG